MLARFKLATRIVLLGISIIICFIGIIAWLHPKIEHTMYDAKYTKTRHLVEAAWSILDHYAGKAADGHLATADAQQAAMAAVKHLRYETNDYFWINDLTPRMVMHPMKPQLDGKDLSGSKDPHGTYLFNEMVEVCQKDGQGFVHYFWPPPDDPEGEPIHKISYVKLLPQWGWIVGSGIYINDVEKELRAILLTNYIATAIITIGGLLLAVFMARSIARPVNAVARGLSDGADQINAASEEITTASQALAQGASDQAAAMEETVASIHQMEASSAHTSELTAGSEALMQENIIKSGISLKSLVQLTTQMTQIESDSDQIGQIIKTIDEIAFQTNLLALNAAVEAARAGEAGAGFAVVADEVRNLAIRATEAARNTQELLDGTIRRVSDATAAIKEINQDFTGIIESATLIGEKTANITQASQDNTQAVASLRATTETIDAETQRTAATAEESAAAAEMLLTQAQVMQDHVAGLLQLIHGAARAADAPKQPSPTEATAAEGQFDNTDAAPITQIHGDNGQPLPAGPHSPALAQF